MFRSYASLTIFVIADAQSESVLAVLDLIQFMVDVIDKEFDDNVTEMDLIFNPDRLSYIIDEVVMDGIVISTDASEVCHELQLRRDEIAQE